ncbi:MAG: pentapeptide repeat-containing protein [Bacteroidota bacterium]
MENRENNTQKKTWLNKRIQNILTISFGVLMGLLLAFYNPELIISPKAIWQNLKSTVSPFFNNFIWFSGLIAWIGGLIYFILGRNKIIKTGTKFYFGGGLINAVNKLINEIKDGKPQTLTISEVSSHIFWRLTRIGIFAIIIATIPFILLFQQNQLIDRQNALINEQTRQDTIQSDLLLAQNKNIERQNQLFENQNEKVTEQTGFIETQTGILENQTDLFQDQNKKIDIQSSILITQNQLFSDQNKLVEFQNTRVDSQLSLMGVQNNLLTGQNLRIDTQNIRINIQNNLLEADRRSSLVFLMSNILDKVDDEIKEQKTAIKGNLGSVPDSIKYSLSKPLINRIVALSKAFNPYKILEADTLSNKLVSPERGQLFIALMENNLDSITQNTIVQRGNFSNAIIDQVNLRGAYLRRADLRGAYLRGAYLRGADLRRAYLFGADLFGADLRGADLRGADLRRAYLNVADLNEADLRRAYLHGADLNGADLHGAYLNGAYLRGADLRGADLRRAYLNVADLSEAKSITTQQLLKAKTLYKSQNLDPTIKKELEAQKPCLFTKEGCPEEEE